MNAEIYLNILRIKGVIGFFCNGGKPAIIPDEEMESIQRPLKNGKNACPVESYPFENYPSKFIYSLCVEEAASR
jgi:transcription antitermination factor NusG